MSFRIGNIDIMVEDNNGVATTTSLEIARVFGKEHKHVLRDISELFDSLNCAGIIGMRDESNFGPTSANKDIVETTNDFSLKLDSFNTSFICTESTYIDGSNREQKMYGLNKDLFTLLVNGYTGKKALVFKIAYIDAFNTMEQVIKANVSNIGKFSLDELEFIHGELWESNMESLEHSRRAEELQIEIDTYREVNQPLIDIADNIMKSDGDMDMMELSRVLNVGRNTLINILKQNGYLMDIHNGVVPYQKWIDIGYLSTMVEVKHGERYSSSMLTPLGREHLLPVLKVLVT